MDEIQKKRWHAEELKRSARVRHGFKGLWDKLTGSYQRTRKKNEREAWLAYKRDRKQQEEMIKKQLTERQNLQTQINQLRKKQEKERTVLTRDLSHANELEQAKTEIQLDDFILYSGSDLEPEI